MIQRKQTLWLLISALLMLVPLFFPYVVVTGGGILYEGDTTGFTAFGDEGPAVLDWPMMVLNMLIILLGLISIFLYKKRVTQMRMTVFNILLKVGLFVLAGVTIHSFMISLGAEDASWRLKWLVSIVPIIAIILDVMAYRAIAIDEMTVRSMYRLRGK
jgi:hypothetical protein